MRRGGTRRPRAFGCHELPRQSAAAVLAPDRLSCRGSIRDSTNASLSQLRVDTFTRIGSVNPSTEKGRIEMTEHERLERIASHLDGFAATEERFDAAYKSEEAKA